MTGEDARASAAGGGYAQFEKDQPSSRSRGWTGPQFTADDWTDGITVATMTAFFTPREAARIMYGAAKLRLNIEPNPQMDEFMRWERGHQWFLFCLSAVARRA